MTDDTYISNEYKPTGVRYDKGKKGVYFQDKGVDATFIPTSLIIDAMVAIDNGGGR